MNQILLYFFVKNFVMHIQKQIKTKRFMLYVIISIKVYHLSNATVKSLVQLQLTVEFKLTR